MLIDKPLRDHREPRDIRIWRDPPGFFRGNACDCHCGAANICCDNTNACATLQFSDDFSSALGGYSEALCSGGTGKTFGVSGGFLTDTFGSGASPKYSGAAGSKTQAITIPALNGLCISVSVVLGIVTGKVIGTTGIGIGGVGNLFGRVASPLPPTAYATRNAAGADECPAAGTLHTWGTVSANFVDGDCVALVLTDTSSGAGTYSLKSYLNGTLMDTFSGQAYTLTSGGSINCGVFDTNGGKWSNLCIATS